MINKLKTDIVNELYAKVPSDVVDFWDMTLSDGGVVRTDKNNNIVAIYLLIHTHGHFKPCEWLKYVKVGEEYQLDSVYSKLDLYNSGSVMHEYRYSADEERTLLATYQYNSLRPIVGTSLATQFKNGEQSEYLYGGESLPPECVNEYASSVGHVLPFWVDSDGHKHWGLIGAVPFVDPFF